MKKRSKFLAVVLSVFLCLSVFSGCGGGGGTSTKSVLYVNTRDAGIGSAFLTEFEIAFEQKYEETSFENGKTGVDIITDATRDNAGDTLISNIARSTFSVSIVEAINYVDYMANDLLYDITDAMDDELSDGSGSIISKLDNSQKAYLTGYDGNYYAAPWLCGFNGITYDAKLFNDNFLYFADANGLKPFENSTYTDKAYTGRGFVSVQNSKKSCGPDGVYETYDDGMPSSYEEFFYLLEYMSKIKSIIPLTYTGASKHYLNYLTQALFVNYAGAEQTSYLYSFDSGDKKANIITSFNGDVPVVEQIKITNDNGYLMKQSEGLYYASKFMHELFSNESSYFYSLSSNGAFSNLDAQTLFYESALNPEYTPIAMLIEGNYWYNECTTQRQSAVDTYGAKAKNRDLRYMVMPSIETGTINVGEGKAPAIGDGLYHLIVVNNNIKGHSVKEKLAKEFLKFCFEDSTLQMFTMSSGLPVSVEYELEDKQYKSMDKFYQSLWDVFSASKKGNNFLSPVSGNKIFMTNFKSLAFSTAADTFWSEIDGTAHETMRHAVVAGKNYKQYFEGMKISESTWNSKYNVK